MSIKINTPAQVSIGYPVNGALLNSNESLLVNAAAIGPEAFLSMELWVDGTLAGVQAAPSGGVQPFSSFFYWLPKTSGNHYLIAAAVDTGGERVYSAQVTVFVALEEGSKEEAQTSPGTSSIVLPAPGGGGYTPPGPPGEGDSVGLGKDWSGSLGDWITSLTAAKKPAAPELITSVEGCETTLSIHDLSDSEEGFAIYRQASNSSNWQQIATLSPQSEFEWITFKDDISGMVAYFVSSFNSQGKSESNMGFVDINPTDCPPANGKTIARSLKATLRLPTGVAGMSYCYQSTDGLHWARWPQLGYLKPDENGFVTGESLLQVLPGGLDGQPATYSFDLFLECWSWQDGILVLLGNFFVEEMKPEYIGSKFVPGSEASPEYFGNQLTPGEGISAEIYFEPVDLGKSGSGSAEFLGGGTILSAEGELQAYSLIGPEIPRATIFATTDPEVCRFHLPPGAQNALGQLMYCFPYPAYDPNLGATSPQPYLSWYILETYECLAGRDDDCLSYKKILALAETTGGQAGFDVTVVSSAGNFIWPVTEPDLSMFVVPPLNCTGEMKFNVRLWYRPGEQSLSPYDVEGSQPGISTNPGLEKSYGQPSNWVSIPCLEPPVPAFQERPTLDITFLTLGLTETDDGGDINSLEIFGYFKVIAPAMGYEIESEIPFLNDFTVGSNRYINLATWDEQASFCPDDTMIDSFSPVGSGCPQVVYNGPYSLGAMELCQGLSKEDCDSGFIYNNNNLRVFVRDGDTITLEVEIWDWDDSSANDLVCQGAIMITGKSLAEWTSISEGYTIITSPTESGQCTVWVEIHAVNQ